VTNLRTSGTAAPARPRSGLEREASAVDALAMKGYSGQRDWSVPRSLYRFEAFNGFGYRGRNVNSP